MTVTTETNEQYEAYLIYAPPGLVGTVGFKVIRPSDSMVVTPRRTTGITEPSEGTYHTVETASAIPGNYLIVWDAEGTETTEELVVDYQAPVYDPSADGYASVEDVREYAPELSTYSDAEIFTMIRKAERDIDWYAGFSGTIDETTGLRFVPLSELEPRYGVAINKATCAQVQYRFYMGPAFTVDEMQYPEIQGRDQTVTRPRRVGPQARSEFPQGLRKMTGRFSV